MVKGQGFSKKKQGLIGGCTGTRYGCCQDGTTSARSLTDPCKGGSLPPTPSSGRVGGRTYVICESGEGLRCNQGTYGCYTGSGVGPCYRPLVCNNTIPDGVALRVNNINYPGQCVQRDNNLVCTFKDYCNQE